MCMCKYIYIYIYIHTHTRIVIYVLIYIHIYIVHVAGRERPGGTPAAGSGTPAARSPGADVYNIIYTIYDK